MWTVSKSYPALGTRSFSNPRSEPTKRTSAPSSCRCRSCARATAGFTCPAVPPQVKMTRCSFPFMATPAFPKVYPEFPGFICRETDSTTPISTSWMQRAVPP